MSAASRARPARRLRSRLFAAVLSAVVVGLGGCASPTEPPPLPLLPEHNPVAISSIDPTAPVTAPSRAGQSAGHPPSAPSKAPECPLPDSGFDCDLQRRITAADVYARSRPGSTGVVLRDRRTGAVWRNDHAGDLTWTASTIKLAMVVDLFARDRAGSLTLTADDRSLIKAMLHSSDDDAADTLWYRYAGTDHLAFNRDFPKYGMTSLRPERGFSDFYPYWGFQKCTPDDLDRLMNHVLGALPSDERAFIVGELRSVAANQQWGVWGAGSAAHPGNKNGWSQEQGGWVMNSVGFVGPGERYTLAVMNNLRGAGAYDTGRATVTELARLLFDGRF